MISIIIVILLIIIFVLYKRETHLSSKLCEADDMLNELTEKVSDLQSGICGQETSVGKCRGDLTTCENKSVEHESEIAALAASIEETKEKLTTAEGQLQFYKQLTFEMKKALDKTPCGMDVTSAPTTTVHDINTLITRIDNQGHLIRQMQMELLDRNARISQLIKRQNITAGMY